MSCGSNSCSSTKPADFGRAIDVARHSSWLWCVLRKLGVMLNNMQRKEIAIEFEKARQRRMLLELDDRLLKDIGVTREQAMREARKPFWK
jgi:uncharacterized protein YjiS (DUF1127 family)